MRFGIKAGLRRQGLLLLILLIGLGAVTGRVEPQEGDRSLGECRSNLKNLLTALEMYSSDHGGRYPSALDQLVPVYLARLPRCPLQQRDTYSAGYTTGGGGYQVCCQGRHPGLPPSYPRVDSREGLVDTPRRAPQPIYTPAAGPAPAPPEPESPVEDSQAALKFELLAAIDEQLNRFQGRCFNEVVSLGDLQKFAAAIERAEIEFSPYRLWRNDSIAVVEMLDPPVMHLSKSPQQLLREAGPARKDVLDTLWHESIHLVESANRDQPNEDPDWEERHTYYYEALMRDFLTALALLEDAAKNPKVSEQGLRDRWKRAERIFKAGAGPNNPTYPVPPDIAMFESWSGIRIRLEDVRKLYASGRCGPRLARAVSAETTATTAKPPKPAPPAPIASGGSPIGFWKGTWTDNRGQQGAGQLDISWHDPTAGVITVSSHFVFTGRASGSTATWQGQGLGRMRLSVSGRFTVNADNRTGSATVTVTDAQGNVTVQTWRMTRR